MKPKSVAILALIYLVTSIWMVLHMGDMTLIEGIFIIGFVGFELVVVTVLGGSALSVLLLIGSSIIKLFFKREKWPNDQNKADWIAACGYGTSFLVVFGLYLYMVITASRIPIISLF